MNMHIVAISCGGNLGSILATHWRWLHTLARGCRVVWPIRETGVCRGVTHSSVVDARCTIPGG